MTRFAFLLGLIAICGTIGVAPNKSLARTPVILDTDIGDDIDDTWALAFLLRNPEFELKLVTTTFGKAEYRAKLAARLLAAANRTDVPVGLGAGGKQGDGKQRSWVENYKLSDYPGKIHDDGVAALIDTIEKSPTPPTVIAIGPLDTLAEALKRRPEIAGKANFVGMDGSVREGYHPKERPMPEWNVKANIPAAQKVFSAPWRHIAITPLDTCGKVRLAGKQFQALKASNDPLAKTVLENYRIWAGKRSLNELDASSTLFDTAAVYLADPAGQPLMKLETLPIRVDDKGLTAIDPAGAKMTVATEWADLDGYHDLLVRRLTGQ
jgi:inosine-uridine nucleoside N-ribohydrolase